MITAILRLFYYSPSSPERFLITESYVYTWATNKGFAVRTTPVYEDEFTITLTEDNFDEYFEFVVLPWYNSFGEIRDNVWRVGVRSKLYDYGFVIKNDYDELRNIIIEFNHTHPYFSSPIEMHLYNLLTFGSGTMPLDPSQYSVRLSRVLSGNVTFSRLVESYTLEKRSNYDSYMAEVLFSGDRYPKSRSVVDGYLY